MNRREFLLALGATACGSTSRRPRRRVRRNTQEAPGRRPVCSRPDFDLSWEQTGPNCLAFHRDLLVQSTADELWLWDSMTMARIGTSPTPHLGFCFLQDGTLVALVDPPGTRPCELHRIDAKGMTIDVLPNRFLYTQDETQLLPAGSPTEVYAAGRKHEVILFRMTKHTIEESAHIYGDGSGQELRQLVSFGDGRLVGEYRDKIRVIEPGKPIRDYETPGFVVHLATTEDGRLWYTHTTKTTPAQTLVLARLSDRLIGDALFNFAPGRVIHLAAGGGAAVALVFTNREAERDYLWTIVVIDNNGRERWRIDVPAELEDGLNLNYAYVAISEHRVVLRTRNHALFAWDAATGQRIE
jgi:hypothetical protein